MDKPNVTNLRDSSPLAGRLQDALSTVLAEDRFGDLSVAQIIGVLEFLKWNLISRSD
jgi:hypothetical protein